LKFTPIDGDEIYKWTGNVYAIFSYLDGVGWESDGVPGEPSFQVGESFFANSPGAANRVWNRVFNP
jgi:hypothetical protein